MCGMLNIEVLHFLLSSTQFLLLLSTLSGDVGQSRDMNFVLFHIDQQSLTVLFLCYSHVIWRKWAFQVSWRLLLKVWKVLHRASFLYAGCFTDSCQIVSVCQGLHLIDTDCYIRLYSALNVCSSLCLVSTDNYVRLYADVYDSDRPHFLLYCRQLSCLVGLTIHRIAFICKLI